MMPATGKGVLPIQTLSLVTGATSGLGLSMAQALLQAGHDVLIAARPTSRLEETVSRLRAQGLPAHAAAVDVRDEASVLAMVRDIEERFGRLDLAENNAGIGMRTVNPRFFSEPKPLCRTWLFLDIQVPGPT